MFCCLLSLQGSESSHWHQLWQHFRQTCSIQVLTNSAAAVVPAAGLLNTILVANISICPIKLYGKAGLGVSRRTAIRLSCTARHHKSAYTHLHFGGLEHCCASQTHMNISHHTIRDFTPNSAIPAVQIPAKPSQTQVSSQGQYNLLAKV